MKRVNLIFAACLVLWMGVWAVGQQPPAPAQGDPPPPRDEIHADMPGPPGPVEADKKDDRRGWWGKSKLMSEQDAREALDVLRRIDPKKAERLEQAMAENPEQVGKVLHDNFPNLGRFMAWRRFDPQGFDLRIRDIELSRQARECAHRLREALDAEDDAIAATERAVLEGLVEDHFDARQQIREHELARLQDRIEDLLAQLEERSSQRAELIAQRVDDLIQDHGDERW